MTAKFYLFIYLFVCKCQKFWMSYSLHILSQNQQNFLKVKISLWPSINVNQKTGTWIVDVFSFRILFQFVTEQFFFQQQYKKLLSHFAYFNDNQKIHLRRNFRKMNVCNRFWTTVRAAFKISIKSDIKVFELFLIAWSRDILL